MVPDPVGGEAEVLGSHGPAPRMGVGEAAEESWPFPAEGEGAEAWPCQEREGVAVEEGAWPCP